ncbi:SDR family oxidoreductase [Polymorphobacter fuscus]|uniref:SDR family NAD(P)-dependent oxidoreductase n=1 Tax=Sandarakinorhabdus fusca TaxID=1439888 RepID=A0A7C9GSV9_9SPHN|nr:SDR family oxidoreductase [Polymorphobacter fuscus]KAB7648261.1 SDR family NAD(P)-dependent oxidoreductase [Polymorphobacter fuscus]MQT15769.1 SDR family NAD(P)-dependent oxidoreductase [Polymorphobacter fuscus]NJC07959.1 short-subunit dehydrogenase [Polymorphobacter fuscus]
MSINLKSLAQQRIIITGATSGIGLAIAEAASAAGARIMLAARNEAALADIRDRLEAAGGDVAILAIDVADPDYAERLAAATLARFGGFDTWVNDAAAATYGTLAQTPIADQRRVFDVGYWGTVNGALTALSHLRLKGGAIINIGSVLSERAMILQGPYSAMKHAVKGFTDALRSEVIRDGLPVSVTLIKPSAMHTPYPEHARNRMPKPAQLPQLIYDPRLVARAVLFAAHTPRRELTVGGFGAGAAVGDLVAPGLLDRAMAAFGTSAQQTDKAPPPGTNDNLYEPRKDGAVESQQPQHVRRQSLWLEAQMHPLGALGIAGAGLGLLAAGLAGARRLR